MVGCGKAADWLQRKLQKPLQENSPSRPPRPANFESNESCVNGDQAIGFNGLSPMAFDNFKLQFKVSRFLHHRYLSQYRTLFDRSCLLERLQLSLIYHICHSLKVDAVANNRMAGCAAVTPRVAGYLPSRLC